MRTETLSYVKEHANHLEIDSPLMITQKGKPKFVLQTVEDFEYQQESIALLKLLAVAEKECVLSEISFDKAFAG